MFTVSQYEKLTLGMQVNVSVNTGKKIIPFKQKCTDLRYV